MLEGARENGDIVSSRKGVLDVRLEIEGRAAHAGVEPERGRSAILEAAHKTVALQALNGRWPGVTVNVGVVHGGTRPNVVAERCVLEVDVRSPQEATFAEAGGPSRRSRTSTPCRRDRALDRQRMAPADGERGRWSEAGGPRHPGRGRTRVRPEGCGHRWSLGREHDLRGRRAVLDGLGPIGGDDHGPKEWLDLSSVVPRISLLAGLLSRLEGI